MQLGRTAGLLIRFSALVAIAAVVLHCGMQPSSRKNPREQDRSTVYAAEGSADKEAALTYPEPPKGVYNNTSFRSFGATKTSAKFSVAIPRSQTWDNLCPGYLAQIRAIVDKDVQTFTVECKMKSVANVVTCSNYFAQCYIDNEQHADDGRYSETYHVEARGGRNCVCWQMQSPSFDKPLSVQPPLQNSTSVRQ
jgi:hypothetical protein